VVPSPAVASTADASPLQHIDLSCGKSDAKRRRRERETVSARSRAVLAKCRRVPSRHHADPIAARARAPACLIANAFTITVLSCMLKSFDSPCGEPRHEGQFAAGGATSDRRIVS
jgi:hypothetical protein